MRWVEFASSRGVTLCFLGMGGLLTGGLMGAAGVDVRLILTALISLLALVLIWLTISWYLEGKKLKRLRAVKEGLNEAYLLGEVLPRPTNLLERQYYEVMKDISASAIGVVEQARREQEEYCGYVESWIHEMKTPLTACSLILTNGGDPVKLRRELKRADNLTENILYSARMRTPQADTLIRKVYAARLMERAVKSQMELLMAACIGVETLGDFSVDTDEKAVEFILKQLLVNSAKYSPGCRITMRAEGGSLTVEDNGIGIPSHEVPRVTDRGFTGTNGRKMGQSTGMGLYLARQICERLDIGLIIESKQGEYTRVCLAFHSLTKP